MTAVFVAKVVFRGGEGSLQCLPKLIDVIPEARLNLVIYYLRQGDQTVEMQHSFQYCQIGTDSINSV